MFRNVASYERREDVHGVILGGLWVGYKYNQGGENPSELEDQSSAPRIPGVLRLRAWAALDILKQVSRGRTFHK